MHWWLVNPYWLPLMPRLPHPESVAKRTIREFTVQHTRMS